MVDLSHEQIRVKGQNSVISDSKNNTTAKFNKKMSPVNNQVKLSTSGGFNADATTIEEQDSKNGGTPGFGTKMMFKPDRTL